MSGLRAVFDELCEIFSRDPANMARIRVLLEAHPEVVSMRDKLEDDGWNLLHHACSSSNGTEYLEQLLRVAPHAARNQRIYDIQGGSVYLRLGDDCVQKQLVVIAESQAHFLIDHGAKFVAADPTRFSDVSAHYRSVCQRRAIRCAIFAALYRHMGMPKDVARLIAQQPIELSDWRQNAKRARK